MLFKIHSGIPLVRYKDWAEHERKGKECPKKSAERFSERLKDLKKKKSQKGKKSGFCTALHI